LLAAFGFLKQAFQGNDMTLAFVRTHHRLDPLRDDPRFDDIVRRMNFPANG
jgi:hypothetical protein